MAVVNNGKPTAEWSSSTSTTGGTSGTFTTTNAHWYVVVVSADTDNSGTAATLSASWGSGGNGETWHTAKFQQADGFSPAQLIAYVQATASVASSSIAITATHITGFEATVSDLTGVDSASPVGTIVTDSTVSHLGPTVTPARTGSLVFAAYGDRNESITLTGNGSTTILATTNPLASSGETFFTAVTTSNTTGGTAVTVGLNSGTATGAVSIGVEIQAPTGGAAVIVPRVISQNSGLF